MLPVAVLWLVNERGNLLIAKRSDTKKHDPGVWGPSVTGKLEANETVEQALSRETQEELGLTADTYKAEHLFNEDFLHADGVTRQMSIYYAKVRSGIDSKIHIDREEVADIKWVSKDEMRELLKTEPGKVLPASAFVIWPKVLSALEKLRLL